MLETLSEVLIVAVDLIGLTYITLLLGVVLAIAAGIVSLVVGFLIFFDWRDAYRVALSSAVLVVVSWLAGHLTGNSREAAVGDVTPVLLTGVGALFVLSIVTQKVDTTFAGWLAVQFSVFFYLGVGLGTMDRYSYASTVDQRSLPTSTSEANPSDGILLSPMPQEKPKIRSGHGLGVFR